MSCYRTSRICTLTTSQWPRIVQLDFIYLVHSDHLPPCMLSRLWSLWSTVCLRSPSGPAAPASSAGFPRPASLSSHSSAVPCTHTKSCLYFCYMTVIFFACGSASLLWLENPEGLFQGINIAIAIVGNDYACFKGADADKLRKLDRENSADSEFSTLKLMSLGLVTFSKM